MIPKEREACFGRGSDPDSGQRVPLSHCRQCPDVQPCALLRLARGVEDSPVLQVMRDVPDGFRPYGRGGRHRG
jgi:hypothetical protein